jgi:hypothetical protein
MRATNDNVLEHARGSEQMAQRRNRKRGHKATGKPVGHPLFTPTAIERQFVSACAGARMSYDEICKVIGAGRNADGKPIAKTTLIRNFKNELANGRAMLKARVIGKFYQALDNDEPWAIQMAMRNQFGWDAGRNGFVAIPAPPDGPREPLQIEFIMPTQRPDDPLDAPQPSRGRDYIAPAEPPTIDVEANRPSSVPIVDSFRRRRGFNWS